MAIWVEFIVKVFSNLVSFKGYSYEGTNLISNFPSFLAPISMNVLEPSL